MTELEIINHKIENNIQLTEYETNYIERMNSILSLKGKVFQHFKGIHCIIHSIAEHTETGENLVIYGSLCGDDVVYARPLDIFASEVDKEKYPLEEAKYRFTEKEDNNCTIKILDDKLSIETIIEYAFNSNNIVSCNLSYYSMEELIELTRQAYIHQLIVSFSKSFLDDSEITLINVTRKDTVRKNRLKINQL